MAATANVTLDTTGITLRQIYIRDPLNGRIPNEHILISNGTGLGYWNSVSSIYQISSLRQVRGNNGYAWHADRFNNMLNVSTTGVAGLLDTYVDPLTSTLMFSNDAAPIQIATIPVPAVSRSAAEVMPGAQTLIASTGQSTFKFLGVGDILFSTVTDLRAVFVSISSFTSQGYADISSEAYAWRPYLSSLGPGIIGGYPSFVSSLPASNGIYWNWSSNVFQPGLPISTVDATNLYATGDAYFSTISLSLNQFRPYINSNGFTKMFLEVRPSYFFNRIYLGSESNASMVKPISTFLQYTSGRGTQILTSSTNSDFIVSQQSNNYTSNVYNSPIRLQIDTQLVLSNMLLDGPFGYYTMYHSLPGGMASFTNDGCDRLVGERSGFSNTTFDNRTSPNNAIFLHICN